MIESFTIGGPLMWVIALGVFVGAVVYSIAQRQGKRIMALETEVGKLRLDLGKQEERHRSERLADTKFISQLQTLIATLQQEINQLRFYISNLRTDLASRGIESPEPPAPTLLEVPTHFDTGGGE